MSHMFRVRNALSSTVSKLRDDIESSHKAGKIPADYSLGFTNALIFFEHQLNMKPGKPKFYDRTGPVIGSLPKPVVLKSDGLLGKEEIFESLRDRIMLEARRMSQGGDGLQSLITAFEQYDGFLDNLSEIETEEKNAL